jgi:hypothetical protein
LQRFWRELKNSAFSVEALFPSHYAIGLRGGDFKTSSPSLWLTTQCLGENAIAIVDQVSVTILASDVLSSAGRTDSAHGSSSEQRIANEMLFKFGLRVSPRTAAWTLQQLCYRQLARIERILAEHTEPKQCHIQLLVSHTERNPRSSLIQLQHILRKEK